jgi:transposase
VDSKGTIAKIQSGERVPVALHEIQVVSLEADRVQVNVNQDVHWIKLGESIGSVTAPKENE